MTERERALIDASDLCYRYAKSLSSEKPELSEVALECATIIDDYREQVLTFAEIGSGSCQEVPGWILKPEIDYTSGLPRQ